MKVNLQNSKSCFEMGQVLVDMALFYVYRPPTGSDTLRRMVQTHAGRIRACCYWDDD